MLLYSCDQVLRGRQGDFSRTPPSALFRGPLPFQTLLSPFVSVFGVSGSLDSISRPEVQKPHSILNGTLGPKGHPRRERRSTASRHHLSGFTWRSHRRQSGLARPPRCTGLGGARGCGAPRLRPLPGRPHSGAHRSPQTRASLPTASTRWRPQGARGSADGMRRGTHRPRREGTAGLTPLALTSTPTCRTSTHSAPAWRSVCSGCGERGQSSLSREPPQALPRAPPPLCADPVPGLP